MMRIFDVLLSSLALLMLFPLFVPLAVLLRLTGEGEIFYVQERVGRRGKLFGVLKFATMLKNSPSIGCGTVTIRNDPRVLPIGHFLRKTKINELPQLINVFNGSMSFIGPRPLVLGVYNAYPSDVKAAVGLVRPGLSGIGSIIFRDEESLLDNRDDAVGFHRDVIGPYKGKLEKWFVENNNLGVYVISVFLTAWVVLFPGSQLIWRIFPSLPEPNGELRVLFGRNENISE